MGGSIMKDLGKISIIPKGDYSAGATYEMIDLVNHSGASWLCKKDCTGQEPSDSNTEFWQRFGTAVDLSNYFPKSGGTIDGNVTVKKESGQLVFNFKNGSRHMAIVLTEAGVCGVLDETNKVWLWNSELNGTTKFYGHASEDLPLTADSSMSTRTVGRSSNNPLILKNTNSGNNQSYIGFATESHGTMGFLGYIGANNPVCILDGTANTLLHTGNKPSGTYTGNGDATVRTIATGGIGSVIAIWSARGIGIVMPGGAFGKKGDSVVKYDYGVANAANGNLKMATTDSFFNENGVTYSYLVL